MDHYSTVRVYVSYTLDYIGIGIDRDWQGRRVELQREVVTKFGVQLTKLLSVSGRVLSHSEGMRVI